MVESIGKSVFIVLSILSLATGIGVTILEYKNGELNFGDVLPGFLIISLLLLLVAFGLLKG